MSRYSFNPDLPEGTVDADALKGLTIIVGWDNPLQTFFGDVEDANGESIRSTMIDMGEFNVQTIDYLEGLLGYEIPGDIQIKLIQDEAGNPEPTPLQQSVKRSMGAKMKAIGYE